MATPRILLVVGGGIAAYKTCELVRAIRRDGGAVTCVLTEAGKQFVTPMTLAALSENPVYTTLWDLKNEVEMGHIQLSRQADLVVVCPATADLLAKMASGIADDLATTLLLATDKPVFAVPAMNVRMWQHEATVRNVEWLRRAGVTVMEPDVGPMACGEFGPGRLPEPDAVWQAVKQMLGLAGAGLSSAPALLEAMEPEDDDEPRSEGRMGLGSLLASIIPRRAPRAEQPLAEPPAAPPWPEGPEELPPLIEGETEAGGDEDAPPGSLLASKGAAKSAPPTDPNAIDLAQTSAESADPLDGQPDFVVAPEHRPLFGKHVLVTAGPTHEPIDPVRYIANRSSGRQGFAIAEAAAEAGARVTLISGPVFLPTPSGVDRVDVETAREMAEAVKQTLPVDVAIMVAAVADWRTAEFVQTKMKKRESAPPALRLTENPDILANVAAGAKRPKLVVGFAAETNDVIENAKAKRKRKGADWIVANDVSGDVMGGMRNRVHIVTENDVESWDDLPKDDVARKLVERIADELA
jgi:phosphopantothenoylcysteine decarboxylase/phosphopantothenate--cysteine ligase